jgi:hypothetical protein
LKNITKKRKKNSLENSVPTVVDSKEAIPLYQS